MGHKKRATPVETETETVAPRPEGRWIYVGTLCTVNGNSAIKEIVAIGEDGPHTVRVIDHGGGPDVRRHIVTIDKLVPFYQWIVPHALCKIGDTDRLVMVVSVDPDAQIAETKVLGDAKKPPLHFHFRDLVKVPTERLMRERCRVCNRFIGDETMIKDPVAKEAFCWADASAALRVAVFEEDATTATERAFKACRDEAIKHPPAEERYWKQEAKKLKQQVDSLQKDVDSSVETNRRLFEAEKRATENEQKLKEELTKVRREQRKLSDVELAAASALVMGWSATNSKDSYYDEYRSNYHNYFRRRQPSDEVIQAMQLITDELARRDLLKPS